MRITPTLDHVQRMLRAQVCANCPHRTPGTKSYSSDTSRPCEANCPLFVRLPVLREAGRQLDPMLADRPRVLRRLVRRVGLSATPVRRYGRKVADTIAQLFDT